MFLALKQATNLVLATATKSKMCLYFILIRSTLKEEKLNLHYMSINSGVVDDA